MMNTTSSRSCRLVSFPAPCFIRASRTRRWSETTEGQYPRTHFCRSPLDHFVVGRCGESSLDDEDEEEEEEEEEEEKEDDDKDADESSLDDEEEEEEERGMSVSKYCTLFPRVGTDKNNSTLAQRAAAAAAPTERFRHARCTSSPCRTFLNTSSRSPGGSPRRGGEAWSLWMP